MNTEIIVHLTSIPRIAVAASADYSRSRSSRKRVDCDFTR